MFAFDSEPELRKLARSAPGARVYCRILVEQRRARSGRSRASSAARRRWRGELMVLAGELGLDPYGLSFHVGSQQMNTARLRGGDRQGRDALHRPARGRGEGAHGQPRRRLPRALPRRRCRRSTISAPPSWAPWREHFGNALPEMVIEPGRFIVGDAGVVSLRGGAGLPQGEGRPGALGLPRHRPLRRPGRDRGRGDPLRLPHAA